MNNRYLGAETAGDSETESGRETPPRMPLWVKVTAAVVGILMLAAVAVIVLRGGNHGPGRHTLGGHTPGRVETFRIPGDEAPGDRTLPAGDRR